MKFLNKLLPIVLLAVSMATNVIAQKQIDTGNKQMQPAKPVITNLDLKPDKNREFSAGVDVEQCDSIFTTEPTIGQDEIIEWSFSSGQETDIAQIIDIHDPYTKVIVKPRQEIKLTLTSLTTGITDEVKFNNTQPEAYTLGGDVVTYLSNPSQSFPLISIHAHLSLPDEEKGYWSFYDGVPLDLGFDLDDYENPILPAFVPDYGVSTLVWTVKLKSEPTCFNTDTIRIISGYGIESVTSDDEMDWNDPNSWNSGIVPNTTDSVTITNVKMNISGNVENIDKLVIREGATLNLGNDKGNGELSVRGLYIEQTAVKENGKDNPINITVSGNSTLNVGRGYFEESRPIKHSGIFLGSGNKFIVQSDLGKAKDGKAAARVNISDGSGLYIEQTAVKGITEFKVGEGGGLYIEQEAVKSKTINKKNPGIVIRGGKLIIEGNANNKGEVIIGGSKGIYIEQTAVKNNDLTGVFVNGGKLHIAQYPTKGIYTKNGIAMNGGGLYIEQEAVKGVTSVHTPYIHCVNGKIRVKGKLSLRGLYIEQEAVKNNGKDTSLIVYESGTLQLDTNYNQSPPYMELNSGAIVSFDQNSTINLNNGMETAYIGITKGASFIDKSKDAPPIFGHYKHPLSDNVYFLGTPFEVINTTTFPLTSNYLSPIVNIWQEANSSWKQVFDFDIAGMQGFAIKYPIANQLFKMSGNLNKGAMSVELINSEETQNSGWNMLSNPYASFIDAEQFEFNSSVNPFIYSYDPINKVVKVYGNNKVSLNGGSRYISPCEAFFVYAGETSDFSITPEMQTHFAEENKKEKVEGKVLKLKVFNDYLSDELAIWLNENASEGFDYEFDAIKNPNFIQQEEALRIYSKFDDNRPYAINALNPNDLPLKVPFFVNTTNNANYTLEMIENTLPSAEFSITLIDSLNNIRQDLISEPSFNFSQNANEEEERFFIEIKAKNTLAEDKPIENVLIYSVADKLYLNSISSEKFQVTIFDISGKILLNKNLTGKGIHTINTNLSSGIYIVQLIAPTGVKQKKIYFEK